MDHSQDILDMRQDDLQQADPEQHLASNGKRFANYLLDSFLYYMTYIGMIVIFSIIVSESGEDILHTGLLFLENEGYYYGSTIVWTIFYYAFSEALWGRTLAKFITRTKVVKADGSPVTPLKAIGRTLARLIPFEPFSFLGNRPVGWHDSLSGTRVVNVTNDTPW